MRRTSENSSPLLKRPAARAGIAAAVLAAAVLALAAVHAAETLPGPVPADVLEIVDGDTVTVKARIWLGQDVVINVRIDGIDTPESVRPGCEAERELAGAARAMLEETLAGGRVLADMRTESGESVRDVMLKSGHARPYDGGKRRDWCGKSQAER